MGELSADDRRQRQTETAMGRQQGIAGHLRSQRAIPQDEVRQDGEHCSTPRTLETPDGDSAEVDSDVMGVVCQVPPAVTGALVDELKADGQNDSQHPFEKRLAITKQVRVGRFIVEIDSDRAVVPPLRGCCGQCVTPRSSGLGKMMRHNGGNPLK
jgi:hypothetical protein